MHRCSGVNHEVSFLWRFLKWALALPWLTGEQNVALSLFFELVDIFRQVPILLRGRIFLVARFRLVSCPQILERTACAHVVHTFEQLLAMDPFFPEF